MPKFTDHKIIVPSMDVVHEWIRGLRDYKNAADGKAMLELKREELSAYE